MYEGVRQIFGPLVWRKVREIIGEEHLPPQPPYILAANHIGFMDAPVLTMYTLNKLGKPFYSPTSPYMVKVWGGSRITRRWLGMLPVDTEHKAAVLDEAAALLRQDNIVGIFPEGGRNTDPGRLEPGKTGAIRLALATGVPLIPVGLISNTGHRIGAALLSLVQPSRYVRIAFGPAVDLSEFRGKPIDKPLLVAATRKLMLAISSLCGKTYPY